MVEHKNMTATRTMVVVERVKILLKGESRYLFSVLSASQVPQRNRATCSPLSGGRDVPAAALSNYP